MLGFVPQPNGTRRLHAASVIGKRLMQHLRASGWGWSLKAFQKIDLLSPHDDIAHESHTLNSSFSKMRNLISDSGARQYCQSTSETIFTYRTLLGELQQRGISQIIEVGPGLVSVVAFANALLHKRLLYSAFEANQMFSDSLTCILSRFTTVGANSK